MGLWELAPAKAPSFWGWGGVSFLLLQRQSSSRLGGGSRPVWQGVWHCSRKLSLIREPSHGSVGVRICLTELLEWILSATVMGWIVSPASNAAALSPKAWHL